MDAAGNNERDPLGGYRNIYGEDFKPTPKMRKFVESLLDGNSIHQAIRDAGASRAAYYGKDGWKNNLRFLDYVNKCRVQLAGVQMAGVDQALFRAARNGDHHALKLCYEVFGGLSKKGGTTVNVNNQVMGGVPGPVMAKTRVDMEFDGMTERQLDDRMLELEARLVEDNDMIRRKRGQLTEGDEALQIVPIPVDERDAGETIMDESNDARITGKFTLSDSDLEGPKK